MRVRHTTVKSRILNIQLVYGVALLYIQGWIYTLLVSESEHVDLTLSIRIKIFGKRQFLKQWLMLFVCYDMIINKIKSSTKINCYEQVSV